MLKVWHASAAAAAALLLLAGPGSAASAKVYVFLGRYGGNADTKVSGSTADITAGGAGTASYIGPGTISGSGKADASSPPCVPFVGIGKMTGKSGTLTFKVIPSSTGCGDEGGHTFSLKGKATVQSGTGKLKGAKGALRFTGFYDRDAGNFSVKFTGLLRG